MSTAHVRLRDVEVVADALVAAADTFPPVMTPLGPAHYTLPPDVARHIAVDVLTEGGAAVKAAFRRAVKAPMRVYRSGSYWWLAACAVCGHVESASHHREALGLAHCHTLECTGFPKPVLEGEPCG